MSSAELPPPPPVATMTMAPPPPPPMLPPIGSAVAAPEPESANPGIILRGGTLAALAAAALIVAGCFGTWLDAGFLSRSGMQIADDAKVIAALGALAGVVALANGGASTRSKDILTAVLALLIGAIGAWDFSQVRDRVESATIDGVQIATVGWGIYAVIAGAVLLLLSTLSSRRS